MCSYIRGMLTSQALLVGVGMGQKAANPTAAVFQFLMRYDRPLQCMHSSAGRTQLRPTHQTAQLSWEVANRDLSGMVGGTVFAFVQVCSHALRIPAKLSAHTSCKRFSRWAHSAHAQLLIHDCC